MTEFVYARRFRWFLYNPLSHILNFRHIKLMDRYFSKLSEVVHGSRTYKWFKKTGNSQNENCQVKVKAEVKKNFSP